MTSGELPASLPFIRKLSKQVLTTEYESFGDAESRIPQAVQAFFQKFVQIYESHGGLVMAHPQHGKVPWMGPGNLADGGMYSPCITLKLLKLTTAFR